MSGEMLGATSFVTLSVTSSLTAQLSHSLSTLRMGLLARLLGAQCVAWTLITLQTHINTNNIMKRVTLYRLLYKLF